MCEHSCDFPFCVEDSIKEYKMYNDDDEGEVKLSKSFNKRINKYEVFSGGIIEFIRMCESYREIKAAIEYNFEKKIFECSVETYSDLDSVRFQNLFCTFFRGGGKYIDSNIK